MDIMAELFNICDPLKPPPEGTYVDLSSARGDESVISEMIQQIEWSDGPAHLLFSGHLGSGKSTELLRFCESIKNLGGAAVGRLFPVYIDASEHVNQYDVDLPEILLAVVSSVSESLREDEKIDLDSPYFRKRWDEIKEFALTPVELEKMEFKLSEFGKFTAKLKRADAESRRKVREKLAPQMPSLLDEVNLVLSKARAQLIKNDYKDLVLVIDNLEKIPDTPESEKEKSAYYKIFVTGGEQLSAIKTHTVLTVPLPLVYSQQSRPMVQTFGEEPFVLPMVKVAHKSGRKYGKGINIMQDILRCRFAALDIGDEEVFASPDVFTYLCKMSGGHVRNLLIYFRSAMYYVDSLPITEKAVKRGIQRHINAYSRAIPEENWRSLAELHLDPDKHIEDKHKNMLGDLSILEYRNGGEPWYAVNPVVRELDKFKRALEAIKDEDASKETSARE